MRTTRDAGGRREAGRARTRERIVAATAALHEEIGPAATTVSAVAERAGVQRLTVYRHFPDEGALYAACGAHTRARHPAPAPSLWEGIREPGERLAAALRAIYAFYASREQATALLLRDAEQLPLLTAALAPMWAYLGAVAEGLAAGWSPPPGGERFLRAALAHALDFRAWRSLASTGLEPEEMVRLMTRFVRAVAAGRGE
jgi:AcrR family transcriptional regulator